MKNWIWVLGMLLISSLLTAQPRLSEEQKEKVKTLRIGVYTRVMNLTSEEATAFWPVYNEYEAEREKLHKESGVLTRELRSNIDDLSEKEVEEKMDRVVVLKVKEAELYESYYNRFKSVLPMKKVALLHKAEREFKRELLKQFREGRERGGGGGKPRMHGGMR